MQTPEIYLNDIGNVFHQLRGHFLQINLNRHLEFVEIIKENEVVKESRKPMQMTILEGKMHKLRYEKLRKKGESVENDKIPNLQVSGSGYYSMDFLWDKLKENDVKQDEPKMRNWRQLKDDEQKEKMMDFLNRFKLSMDSEIWMEMTKDVLKKLKSGELVEGIVWHKNSQKIMEIPKLVINESCFFWGD